MTRNFGQGICREQNYAVIHFAGLKAVGESCEKPLYITKQPYGEYSLVSDVGKQCQRLVFSSSATVYGVPKRRLDRKDSLSAVNPFMARPTYEREYFLIYIIRQ